MSCIALTPSLKSGTFSKPQAKSSEGVRISQCQCQNLPGFCVPTPTGMFLPFSLTPRQRFALFKTHFPRGSTALAAGLSCALKCGWQWLCMAGYSPRHHCPLPTLPVALGSFPQLPLHCAEKAAEMCCVLLSRERLEIQPLTFGVCDLSSLLHDHLKGPGCPGTLWLVVQRSLFSGKQTIFLHNFKANYPISVFTEFCFVLVCVLGFFWR